MTWAHALAARGVYPGRGGRKGETWFDWALGRRLWDTGMLRTRIALRLGCTVAALDKRRAMEQWPRRCGERGRTDRTPLPKLRRCEECEQLTPAVAPCQCCGASGITEGKSE